jgi:hypothetical protein
VESSLRQTAQDLDLERREKVDLRNHLLKKDHLVDKEVDPLVVIEDHLAMIDQDLLKVQQMVQVDLLRIQVIDHSAKEEVVLATEADHSVADQNSVVDLVVIEDHLAMIDQDLLKVQQMVQVKDLLRIQVIDHSAKEEVVLATEADHSVDKEVDHLVVIEDHLAMIDQDLLKVQQMVQVDLLRIQVIDHSAKEEVVLATEADHSVEDQDLVVIEEVVLVKELDHLRVGHLIGSLWKTKVEFLANQ